MKRLQASLMRAICLATLLACCPLRAADEPPVPAYEELLLEGIYPAGAQRGQTVTVEIWGPSRDRKGGELGGLQDARGLIIDGPPGISVREVKNLSASRVQALLEIAADAAPGRRMLRVACDRVGATSGTWFVVGTLPEVNESAKNDEPAKAQAVTLPVVVNGRVEQPLDADCFRFQARAGQKIVAAVNAHGIDRHSRGRGTMGFIDASLELLGPDGAVVADAQDTLGLDPLVHFTIPRDGEYVARVFLLGYLGCPEAVYRLTLGEVPYPTAVFPAGGRRGETVELTVSGPNVPPDSKIAFQVPDDPRPVIWIVPPGGHHEVPFVLGDLPEQHQREPNDSREAATRLSLGETVNGRFDQSGDSDWYQLDLAAMQRVRLDVVAQRYLRQGVDTLVEIYDAKGEQLASNDDVKLTDVEVLHDFEPFDSGLTFDAKQAGAYFVRISEQSAAAGDRAAYRLTVSEPQADFAVHQWPDVVPIWGPGSTAALLATVDRLAVVGAADIELRIEGLPDGWKGSTAWSLGTRPGQPHAYGRRVFLTITAPSDAPVGAIATFQVVGRAKVRNETIQRVAQPLTTYIPTDRTYCRWSMQSRAIVTAPRGPHLETQIPSLTVVEGNNTELPVRLIGGDDGKWSLVANLARNSFQCVLGVPQAVNFTGGEAIFPLKTDQLPAGTHSIVVARAWDSEVRKGMPGPCTSIVQVHVTPKDAAAAK